MEKLILFGAGKVGRSFIGQLFSLSGFEVVFIDISKTLIDELNNHGQYNVVIKSDKEEIIVVRNVRGVCADNTETISNEILNARILAVSVGLSGLADVMPVLAKSLLERYEFGNKGPVDIIIAENMRNAAGYFKKGLSRFLPESYPLDKLVGLVETSIGKMVPIMLKKDIDEDILQVFAEPYNTLILDKKAFKNLIPEVKGLEPKDNIKAWGDRKLFIHNLGHAAVAYCGFAYDSKFICPWQALQIPSIYDFVRDVMLQSANVLLRAYPDEFSIESLTEHIDDLLLRFRNKFLGDTIFRVGCDLFRKLGPDDRIVGAIRFAQLFMMPYDRILNVLLCACRFRAKDESGKMLDKDLDFVRLYDKGVRNVLVEVCGFNVDFDNELINSVEELDKSSVNLQ